MLGFPAGDSSRVGSRSRSPISIAMPPSASATEAASGLVESGRRNARARSTPESASPTRPSASHTRRERQLAHDREGGTHVLAHRQRLLGRRSAVTRSPRSNATRPCVRTASTMRDARPVLSIRHHVSACSARCSASVSRPSTRAARRAAPVMATCCRFGVASGSKVCSRISRAPSRSPSHSRVPAPRRVGPLLGDLVGGGSFGA